MRSYVYRFETKNFFGRIIGFNLQHARKLLRQIMKRKVLPANTMVFREIGVR